MYRHILFASLALVLFSCSTPEKPEDVITINHIEAEIAEEDNYDYDTLSGMYIGDFAGSDIRIRLNYVSKKNAIGYNNYKGLQRNLTGKVSREDKKVTKKKWGGPKKLFKEKHSKDTNIYIIISGKISLEKNSKIIANLGTGAGIGEEMIFASDP